MQGPTGSEFRVLQIHPSLRCNLKCQHCYSSSSPESTQELPLELILQAVSDARTEGYNVLGVSGGEPLLYKPLPLVLQQARKLGMTTSITTNGILLNQRKIEDLREHINLIAISLDGVAQSHNRMRGTSQAFELMTRCLEDLREAKVCFGFIFTLTLHNLNELEIIADFAVEQGASLLQVHPLEEVGRAEENLVNSAPDELELAYAFLEVARIQELYADKLQIQFDIASRQLIRDNPERVFALDIKDDENVLNYSLSELVSPLIIENDGSVVPIQYGFSHNYAIGNIKEGSLIQQAKNWKTSLYQPFLKLSHQVFESLVNTDNSQLPFANWYGLITQASQQKIAEKVSL